ncbi:hypothetical protein STEG23_006664 [Scotinomys teguina]
MKKKRRRRKRKRKEEKKGEGEKEKERRMPGASHTARQGIKEKKRYTEIEKGTSPIWILERPDFGDGGAFPEIHVTPVCTGYGVKEKKMSNALAIRVDPEGKIKYDAVTRQGQSKEKVVYSKYTDLVPKEVMNADDPDLQRPDKEAIKKITEKTRVVCITEGCYNHDSLTSWLLLTMSATYHLSKELHSTLELNRAESYSNGRNVERSNGAAKVQD